MPFRGTTHDLIFGYDEGKDEVLMPDADSVAHAASWAGTRGYFEVAASLMGLAHALNNEQMTADVLAAANVPTYASRKYVGPAIDATPPPVTHSVPVPEGYCGHGYRVIVGRHVATNGICGQDPILDNQPVTCHCLGYEHAPTCPEADDAPDRAQAPA